MSRTKARILTIAAAVLIAAPFVRAVPNLISYQGLLNNQNGTPVNGTVSFVFAIYGAPTGGTALWTEAQTVSVSNGIFNVQLGSAVPLPATLFATDALYVGVKVGADSEMTPRQRLMAGAFSRRAEVAQSLAGGVVPANLFKDAAIVSPPGFTATDRANWMDGDVSTSGYLRFLPPPSNGSADYVFDLGRVLSANVTADYLAQITGTGYLCSCGTGVVNAWVQMDVSQDNVTYTALDPGVQAPRVLKNWWRLRFRYLRIRVTWANPNCGGCSFAQPDVRLVFFELHGEEK